MEFVLEPFRITRKHIDVMVKKCPNTMPLGRRVWIRKGYWVSDNKPMSIKQPQKIRELPYGYLRNCLNYTNKELTKNLTTAARSMRTITKQKLLDEINIRNVGHK